jgi:hypothetical protein
MLSLYAYSFFTTSNSLPRASIASSHYRESIIRYIFSNFHKPYLQDTSLRSS